MYSITYQYPTEKEKNSKDTRLCIEVFPGAIYDFVNVPLHLEDTANNFFTDFVVVHFHRCMCLYTIHLKILYVHLILRVFLVTWRDKMADCV